jgi:hypothetical protein
MLRHEIHCILVRFDTTSIKSQSLLDEKNTSLVNETENQLYKQNRVDDSTALNNTWNTSKTIVESMVSSNGINDTLPSSLVLSNESLKIESNMSDSLLDTNMTQDTLTSTNMPSILNQQETLAPIISSPWLKGMLINTKSLPELFKIIEKLNFNLTLSNRYLQELSQHYV